jgi:ectoine hydroxylase-related dioxygenase (phytanoyl-CoA dioxygenase family)
MTHPAVRRIAQDLRMMQIAARWLDGDPVPFKATLFDKSSAQNWLVAWHQDTSLPLVARTDASGWGPWSVKRDVLYAKAPATALSRVIALRIQLDDSRLDNGPLRVLPNTHARGILSDEDIQRLVTEAEPVDCVAAAGSVVAMRPLLLHASSKATSAHPRRVLHIEYADSVAIGDGLELAIV